MNSKENIIYHPKGSMCASCKDFYKDCSGLDFGSMRVIGFYTGHNIVKCEGFKPLNLTNENT